MQIVAINRSLQPQKIWLKFDNNSLLPLKIDDLVVLNLKKYSDIDSSLYQKIQEYSAKYILSEYALRQIAISPKTAKLLNQKLQNYCTQIHQKYSYSLDIVSSLINPIIEDIRLKGLLDETKFVEYYLHRHPKMSRMQIKYNLHHLGIDFKSQESDKDKILKLLIKKGNLGNLTDFKTKTKLISSLYRKGFAIDDVKTAIDEYLSIR